MSDCFEKVKGFLLAMGMEIVKEDAAEELVIVQRPESGIVNMIVDCEDPILVIEQPIMSFVDMLHAEDCASELMRMNRTLVHGAFCYDDGADNLIWRDTLRLEHLDYNELEGSIKALELALNEFGDELIAMNDEGEL